MELQSKNLVQQGYGHLNAQQLTSLRWGLRFTPTVCMLGSLYGLYTHNALLLVSLAMVGIVPFWFPASHPLDRLYNSLIAPTLGLTRLPPNPLPRRIACVAGGVMNLGAAGAFFAGLPTLAYAIGGMLFVLQLIVNTTHFCMASFGIEQILRLLGRSLPLDLVEPDAARRMVADGAMLLDVRDSSEHQLGHIDGSRNVPLCAVESHADEFRASGQPLVIYCRSGARANLAIAALARAGVPGLFNLGSMQRWEA